MKVVVYSVVVMSELIPYIPFSSTNKDKAVDYANKYAEFWDNDDYSDIYFNQQKDGYMDESVKVVKHEADIK